MTPSRLFLFVLVFFTIVTALIYRPVYPTVTPSLNSSLARVGSVPQRQSVLGYDRAAFGDWAPMLIDGQSCTTRHLILSQTFQSAVAAGCEITPTPVTDPYTGSSLPEDIQIDHIFPLRAAWDLGAHSWPAEKRKRFANDPSNLVAVSAQANQEKSDLLPSQWMPEVRRGCWYARRLAAVAAAYELPLPRSDRRVMQRACSVSEFPAGWLG